LIPFGAHFVNLAQPAPVAYNTDEYVLAPIDISARHSVLNDSTLPDEAAFALRARGDSMVGRAGGLSFPDGCVIVVDPTVKAEPGDFVVAMGPGAEQACFGVLDLHGEQRSLKMLNPLYALQSPLAANPKIVGVVTSVQVSILRR
jgi:SOS-response transcriptional repressor LexA